MTLPPLEPRSSTLDTLDAAADAVTRARRGVLDEVAFLATEIDRLRAECARLVGERDAAVADGRVEERSVIVAWLRSRWPIASISIERGEHRQNPFKPATTEHPHAGCLDCDGFGRILEDHDGRAGYRACPGPRK